MPYFKDKTNALHFLDDAVFAHLLPAGSIAITDAEASQLQTPTLAEAKAWAWAGIKTERDRRKSGGVQISGKWFHTDDPSRIQYSILDGKATRASLPAATVLHPAWKTMSGEKTPMTVAVLRQVLDAGIVYDGAVFDAAETHRAAMEASADPASYDFSSGWPVTYAESVL